MRIRREISSNEDLGNGVDISTSRGNGSVRLLRCEFLKAKSTTARTSHPTNNKVSIRGHIKTPPVRLTDRNNKHMTLQFYSPVKTMPFLSTPQVPDQSDDNFFRFPTCQPGAYAPRMDPISAEMATTRE